jgi:hypothetical protein
MFMLRLCLAKPRNLPLVSSALVSSRLLWSSLLSMDVYRENLAAAKAARRMLQMDWVARRDVFEKCLRNSSRRFCMTLAAQFGPDQLLQGTATGVWVYPDDVVVLQWKKKKQMLITNYFAMRVE